MATPITSTKKYGKPAIGCYLDHGSHNVEELDRAVIELAEHYGYVVPDEDAELLDADEAERNELLASKFLLGDDDWWEVLNEIAEIAIAWLNEQETRSFLYWGHEGEAGAFGLWPSVESAQESCEFASRVDQEYPAEDFRGEWLHINERGNATLYVRCNMGEDHEVWSVV